MKLKCSKMVLKQKESKKSKTLFKSDRNRKSCFLVILSNLFLFPLPPQGKSQGSTVNSLTVNLPTHSRGNPSFESLNVIILYYYYIILCYYIIILEETKNAVLAMKDVIVGCKTSCPGPSFLTQI